MKVFISWSGVRSHKVGLLITEWLEDIIQNLVPWISSKDIDSGTRWSQVLNNELGKASIGIICLTQENKSNPWILFESGALAKQPDSIVGTFLIDLENEDLMPPLSQFNHTAPNKESMLKLIKTINSKLGDKGRDESKLENSFNDKWERFLRDFKDILANTVTEKPVEERTEKNILLEILSTTRSLAKRIPNDNESKKASLYKSVLKDVVESKGNEKLIFETLHEAIAPYEALREMGKNEGDILASLLKSGFSFL